MFDWRGYLHVQFTPTWLCILLTKTDIKALLIKLLKQLLIMNNFLSSLL